MRVYELAKELKMDNKELLRELMEMGLDVRNHMSIMSDEDTQAVMDKFSTSRSETVEEKRVTSRVIRRRRKKVEPEAGELDAADMEGQEEEGDYLEDEAPVEARVSEPALEEAAAPRAAGAPGEESARREAPEAAEPATRPAPETPAREEKPPVAEAQEPVLEKAPEMAAAAQAPPVEHAVPEATAALAEAEKASAPAAEAPRAPDKPAAGVKPEAQAKPKAKGDQPARIIARPEPPAKVVARPEAKAPARSETPAKPGPRADETPRAAARPEPPARPAGEGRPQTAAPSRPAEGQAPRREAPTRPEGERGPRFEGERGSRFEGERGSRPEGERGPRPEGERGPRPEADRGPRPEGDRGPRPERDAKRPPKRKPIKDEPARIISRPVAPPPGAAADSRDPRDSRDTRDFRDSRPPRPAGPTYRPPSRPPAAPAPDVMDIAPPADKGGERTRSRRKKGKKTGAVPDNDELMRRATSGKRKEILEKADLYGGRGARGKRRGMGGVKRNKKTEVTTPKAIKRRIKVGEAISAGELAKRMGIKATEMVARLMRGGMMVTVNQALDVEEATLVASEFGFEVDRVGFEEGSFFEEVSDNPEDLQPRPPVVTIMGHVDHGKTSLLDKIRQSNVASGEAGGITQHIGAYDVHLPDGGQVVFVDTPGHAAFTQMRARGAQVTDVVVLVVAADDGVMQQTKEAIAHAKAAKVPIVVAVNKMDKPGADPDKVRRELAEYELVSEDWGGETIFVNVSAKTGQGVPELLEMLNLQTELLELRANPNKPAKGHVLEARLDKGRGAVATVLVQDGTLKPGDSFVSGVFAGKIRAMFDDLGRRVETAGPSIPVEVQGFYGVPEAGDDLVVIENEKDTKRIAEHRQMKKREAELSAKKRTSLESFMDKMKEGEVQELKLVVKADMQGSVEALVEALGKLGNELVKVNVIHSGAGAITETDVMLASASEAIIVGFNVRPGGKVSEVAEAEHVEIRSYDVIYALTEDITKALTGMLAPTLEEEVIGRAEVRETFSVPKIGTIAGSYVQHGKVERNSPARLLRDGVVIATTKVGSLRRFKEDVKEVQSGFECGIGLDNYNDIKVGDEIEVYVIHERAGEL